MEIDSARLQQTLNQLEAEMFLMRTLLCVLVDKHPAKAQVLQAFQVEAEASARHAPSGIDPEFVVELRARLQMYLQMLA